MIEKKTVIDQIEVSRNGTINIRFGLLLLEDGIEIGCQWHRSVIEPGGDVDVTIAAVNSDITTRDLLRAAKVDGARLPELKSICALVHTPDTVKKYQQSIARQREKTESH